jgi:hypothetical protein
MNMCLFQFENQGVIWNVCKGFICSEWQNLAQALRTLTPVRVLNLMIMYQTHEHYLRKWAFCIGDSEFYFGILKLKGHTFSTYSSSPLDFILMPILDSGSLSVHRQKMGVWSEGPLVRASLRHFIALGIEPLMTPCFHRDVFITAVPKVLDDISFWSMREFKLGLKAHFLTVF